MKRFMSGHHGNFMMITFAIKNLNISYYNRK